MISLLTKILQRAWSLFVEGNCFTVGVFAVIISDDGKVFLTRERGRWGLPGGNISRKDIRECRELSSSKILPIIALWRELGEEIRISPEDVDAALIGPAIFPSAKHKDMAYAYLLKIEHPFSLVEEDSDLPIRNGDWFSREKALARLAPGTRFGDMISWAFSVYYAQK